VGRDEDEARLTDDDTGRALRVAERIAADCSNLLGDLVVAVILHGSRVLGDFRPSRSDVDILVVVERPLPDGDLDAVRDAVVALRESAPGGIDVRVVTRAVAAALRDPGRSRPQRDRIGLGRSLAPRRVRRRNGEGGIRTLEAGIFPT
jgi:streptomycin 3"-adenylyltransferase